MTVSTPILEGALARRLERLTLVSRRRLMGQGQGDRRSLRKGSSLEFADYRHYVAGDDPSRVDWNILARTGSLFVRVYEEEEVLDVHLLLDVSRSMDWGEPNKLHYGRRVVAALGYVALSSAARLRVRLLDASGGTQATVFGPAWGRARAAPLVQFLQRARPARDITPLPVPGLVPAPPNLDAPLAGPAKRTPALTIYLSDLLSPTWAQALRGLAARSGDVVVLHLLSPQELRPQLGGDVRLIDRESGATVPVTLNNDALRLYGGRLTAWQTEIEELCRRHHMGYAPVDTEVPVETLLFQTLRQRGVVR